MLTQKKDLVLDTTITSFCASPSSSKTYLQYKNNMTKIQNVPNPRVFFRLHLLLCTFCELFARQLRQGDFAISTHHLHCCILPWEAKNLRGHKQNDVLCSAWVKEKCYGIHSGHRGIPFLRSPSWMWDSLPERDSGKDHEKVVRWLDHQRNQAEDLESSEDMQWYVSQTK